MNAALPINPTIIRIMRVLRIARGTAVFLASYVFPPRPYKMYLYGLLQMDVFWLWVSLCFCPTVLKLLKMATGMRALLDTVMQALPQVPNVVCVFIFIHLFIHQLIQ